MYSFARLLAVSVLSTLTMDLGALVQAALRLSPSPGKHAPRWIAWCLRGRFLHPDITAAAPLPAEIPTALVVHHAIGFTLAFCYVALFSRVGLLGNPVVGLLYGAATSVFAWLLMFPAMGFGPFGARSPAGTSPILAVLLNHMLFGLALALWSRLLLRAHS
jgi:hypothetical protein